MAGISRAIVINIGTLGAPWVEAIVRAGKETRLRKIPVVLDPAGSGATKYRTTTSQKLIHEIHPMIIRGNASEIRSRESTMRKG
jgi:hydroxyethylthiazole kinase